MNLERIQNAIKARHAELSEAYSKRREALLAAVTDNGKQQAPNYSSSGWHAPHDGWTHLDTGEVYGKGQWVPLPKDDWNYSEPTEPYPHRKYRMLVPVSQRVEFTDIMRNWADLGFGKEFDRDGALYVYAYLTGYDPIIKVVEAITAEEEQEAREAEKATKGTAPQGKTIVEAVVKFLKHTVNDYGVSIKMLVVMDNGSTAWGTRPQSLAHVDELQGKRIRFSGSFERAAGDTTHAYFTRPTKAELITEEEKTK
ncbi:hypothetical protein [Pantoea phage Nafs113]|nr:hypothetical protein [Pantoea phage Nafs113]